MRGVGRNHTAAGTDRNTCCKRVAADWQPAQAARARPSDEQCAATLLQMALHAPLHGGAQLAWIEQHQGRRSAWPVRTALHDRRLGATGFQSRGEKSERVCIGILSQHRNGGGFRRRQDEATHIVVRQSVRCRDDDLVCRLAVCRWRQRERRSLPRPRRKVKVGLLAGIANGERPAEGREAGDDDTDALLRNLDGFDRPVAFKAANRMEHERPDASGQGVEALRDCARLEVRHDVELPTDRWFGQRRNDGCQAVRQTREIETRPARFNGGEIRQHSQSFARVDGAVAGFGIEQATRCRQCCGPDRGAAHGE